MRHQQLITDLTNAVRTLRLGPTQDRFRECLDLINQCEDEFTRLTRQPKPFVTRGSIPHSYRGEGNNDIG